jgi:hypothetical protein
MNPTGKGGFKPGTSGNPTGKRKLPADIRTLARQHTTAALKTLAAIMNDEKAPLSVGWRPPNVFPPP